MKKIIISIACVVTVCMLAAQPSNLDSVKIELYKINKVFDSSVYLGFDVDILYASDTLRGRFDREEMKGKYVLNNRNIYYNMGNIEYAQNDSFVYNIYHDEKMMYMTKDVISANSSLFPLKSFVDSIITWYDTSYSIALRAEDDLRVIEFNAIKSGVPYEQFAVYYDSTSHYPAKFEITFYDALNNIPEVPDTIAQKIRLKPVKKKITMSFSNYYNPETLAVFDDESYVSFDRLRNKYRPNRKFKSYRFMTNGVNADEGDPDGGELYPSPDEN